MFSQLFTVIAIATAVIAVPTGPAAVSQCNTGAVQCCNSLQSADNKSVTDFAALLGVVVQGVTGQVGLQCSPITAIGLGGGASCQSQPVCCENNHYNGLINVGCSPINAGL